MSNYITKRTYVVLSIDPSAPAAGCAVPIVVTDSFQKAVEAAEMHANELARLCAVQLSAPPPVGSSVRSCEPSVESLGATSSLQVAFLMEGGVPPACLLEGYFGRWKLFNDADGEADMALFRRYKKPDGFIASGPWREKPLFPVNGALAIDKDCTVIAVRTVFSEYFHGHYQAFARAEVEPGERLSTVCVEEGSNDEEDY